MRVRLREPVTAQFNGYPTLTGGPVTSPGAFANIIFTQVAAGTYTISWSVTLAGTVGAADVNNFALYVNGIFIASSVNPGVAGTYPQTAVIQSPNGTGGDLKILTNGAGTVGSQYSATIPRVTGGATAKVGPISARERWFPENAHVSASSNVNEASCTVFVGPSATPPYFRDQTISGSTGDSTDKINADQLTTGEYVWAVWAQGDPQAIGTLVVTGGKDV